MAPAGRRTPNRLHTLLLVLWTLSRDSTSSQVRQEFRVLEEQPLGTYVGTIETRPSFTYRFSESHQLFSINGTTGVISTSAVIDREALQSGVINVVVLSSQPTYPTEVRIVVLDMNDNAPVFPDPSIVVAFKEDASSGRQVILDTATDSDIGSNGVDHTTYRIVDGNEQGRFRLDITVNPSGEGLSAFYQLLVQVEDKGEPRRSGYLLVIFVNDINDHPPVFQEAQYRVDISEDVPKGSYIKGVSATDGDSGQNANLRYSLVSGNGLGWFAISENSGLVTSAAPLDRETASEVVLNISAKDQGLQPKISYTRLVVTILDVNDQAPAFAQSSAHVSLVEHAPAGTELLLLSATDGDLQANGTVTFSFDPETPAGVQDKFRLDGASGRLSAAAELDREEAESYLLYIRASDGGRPPLHSTARVNVTLDLNDNAPRFMHAVEHVSAVENWSAGHQIFQASASDPDEGANGAVAYSLKQNPRGLFHVHERHGLVTLTGPLEVAAGSYQVEVLAADMGVPRHTSSLLLAISVYDVNDNPPVFDQPLLRGPHPGVRVAYDIAAGNAGDAFGIFPDGQLYIKAELDRETQDRYLLLLVATDRAVEPLSASVNVTVVLDDVNDNRPLFNSTSYVFHFQEEQGRGALVGRVFAEDKDFGPNGEVRYAFETPQANFELDAMTGELSSTLVFDRELLTRQRGAAVFSFSVVSSDQGLPKPLRDQAKVQVYIQDINDNPPKFTKDVYQASISELAVNMTQLLRVSASDVDEDKNGLVHYRIEEGNEEAQFAMDSSSGQVTLVGKLDYESTSSYSLKIVAVDSGLVPLSSSCMLSVSVLDENDNAPSFPKSTLTVDVLENMRIGEFVASVTATDSDSGPNAEITYSIVATNNHGTFSISPNTGSVFLVKKLDYETQSTYKLNVTANDNGRPPRSSSIPVVIHVRDFNDNPPVFTPGDIFKSISENLPLSSSVMSISAHDTDADINGQLEYSIVQQTPRGSHFRIDPAPGSSTPAPPSTGSSPTSTSSR
uniref:Cadherin domain-containing protein n=1 Tax=Denticeps clupeoides TaxID=299321 RepID=A0AAY4CI45_9TELE